MILVEAFEVLRAAGRVNSQREFSTDWLGRTPSYMACMVARATERTPSTDVLLRLCTRIQQYAVEAGANRQAIEQLANRVMSEIHHRITTEAT